MENYEIVTNIGKGSSGSVFLAKSRKLKKLVAIKEIEIDENRKSRCKKSVVREASILKRLAHPFIVECIEWFLSKENKSMQIVLEYCNGGTMQDMVRMAKNQNKFFPDNKILKWMTEITSAVAYMHERKILHRDLKTENVFILKPDTAKLGDFGISKEIDHTLDLAQTCVGTPCYLSPELCQDIPYNAKSDIWALGCLLFEISALSPAFDAANLVSLFYKIVKGDFAELPQHCSADVRELVELILQKDPELRPTAEKLLEHHALSIYFIDKGNNKSTSALSNPVVLQKFSSGTKGEETRKKPPKLAELRHKSGAIEEYSSRDTQDTITNDILERTLSPSPAYAYNMFMSGVKSKSTLDNTTGRKLLPIERNSNNVANTNRSSTVLGSVDKMMDKSCDVPKLFNELHIDETPVEDNLNADTDVVTARPQTCPHSASRRVAMDYVEDSFTETVVTWSGYGDRGSRHSSGHTRHRDSISLSSGSEESSSYYDDAEYEATPSNHAIRCSSHDKKSSDSSLSFQDDSDEIVEELIQDQIAGDDDIPEVIDSCGDGEDFLPSDQNGDAHSSTDNVRILPGSAWLRSKRVQVMQRRKQEGDLDIGNGDHGNDDKHRSKRKLRLPGSSWLSREDRNSKMQRESSSDDAIVLGQERGDSSNQGSRHKAKRKSGKIRNLPGSAWLKNSKSQQKNSSTEENKVASEQGSQPMKTQQRSLMLESCSSSANELSAFGKRESSFSDSDSSNYSYPEDFEEYEDDFEVSDEDSDSLEDSNQKSSLDMVRKGCLDLLGEEVYEDLSSLFHRGLTLSEVVTKFKRRKVATEMVETCYLLLQKH